jgi:hypothetical protein
LERVADICAISYLNEQQDELTKALNTAMDYWNAHQYPYR